MRAPVTLFTPAYGGSSWPTGWWRSVSPPSKRTAAQAAVRFTYEPRPRRSDADRNCISNIRPDGLAPELAAATAQWLIGQILAKRLSGVGLKDGSAIEAGGSLAHAAPAPVLSSAVIGKPTSAAAGTGSHPSDVPQHCRTSVRQTPVGSPAIVSGWPRASANTLFFEPDRLFTANFGQGGSPQVRIGFPTTSR